MLSPLSSHVILRLIMKHILMEVSEYDGRAREEGADEATEVFGIKVTQANELTVPA